MESRIDLELTMESEENTVSSTTSLRLISDLEENCKDSQSFLTLCKFLKGKNYTHIPENLFMNLLDLKRANTHRFFCIRDTSEDDSRSQRSQGIEKFEVICLGILCIMDILASILLVYYTYLFLEYLEMCKTLKTKNIF